MPRTVTITLAGVNYTVTELRARDNAAWRKRLDEHFHDLSAVLSEWTKLEINVDTVGRLVNLAREKLLGSADIIADLVCSYSPQLAENKEQILSATYDSELMAAFVEVLKLAFPFGPLVASLAKLLPST